jgi:hypothetical protein
MVKDVAKGGFRVMELGLTKMSISMKEDAAGHFSL